MLTHLSSKSLLTQRDLGFVLCLELIQSASIAHVRISCKNQCEYRKLKSQYKFLLRTMEALLTQDLVQVIHPGLTVDGICLLTE